MSLLPAAVLALAPLLLAALAVPPLRRLAWRVDLVDHPAAGAHKSHGTAVPYGGGVAILLAAAAVLVAAAWCAARYAPAAGVLVGLAGQGRTLGLLLAGAAVLLLVGLMDDWRGLPPAPRFALQLLTAGLLVTAAPEFRLGVCSQWPMVSGGLAAVWIAAMTNAFNFLDNMDGLAAGIAAVSLALLAAMSLMAGHAFSAVVGLVLVGAIAGFLLYNFPPASIFMGDAGGFALGFLVGGLSAGLSHHCGPALPQALLPLLALSLPAYDFTTIILLRLCRGVPPWRGDRNHVSHRLVRRGLSRRGAVLLIYLVTLVAGLPAVVALSAPAGTGWVWLVVLLALGAMGGWLDLARGRAYPP